MSTSEKKKRGRKFTPEFQLQAVKRVLAGHPVRRRGGTGTGRSLLHNWVTRHRLTEGGGALQVEQAAEIARLKRALAHRRRKPRS